MKQTCRRALADVAGVHEDTVDIGVDDLRDGEQCAVLHRDIPEQAEVSVEDFANVQNEQNRNHRAQIRERYMQDLLPFACAVQSGSLIEGRIDTDQRCDVDQASVSYALPAVRDNQDRRPVFRFLVPLNRVNVEQRKDRVVDKTIFCTQKRIYDVA